MEYLVLSVRINLSFPFRTILLTDTDNLITGYKALVETNRMIKSILNIWWTQLAFSNNPQWYLLNMYGEHLVLSVRVNLSFPFWTVSLTDIDNLITGYKALIGTNENDTPHFQTIFCKFKPRFLRNPKGYASNLRKQKFC